MWLCDSGGVPSHRKSETLAGPQRGNLLSCNYEWCTGTVALPLLSLLVTMTDVPPWCHDFYYANLRLTFYPKDPMISLSYRHTMMKQPPKATKGLLSTPSINQQIGRNCPVPCNMNFVFSIVSSSGPEWNPHMFLLRFFLSRPWPQQLEAVMVAGASFLFGTCKMAHVRTPSPTIRGQCRASPFPGMTASFFLSVSKVWQEDINQSLSIHWYFLLFSTFD